MGGAATDGNNRCDKLNDSDGGCFDNNGSNGDGLHRRARETCGRDMQQ